ncbi:MAG: helix-turn-helix transcriptional regulator [Ktedonobacteraceae bacterium]|nr:helix-turn-helix transcriptional regulator [Ktedonobacteraceae bacterium]
MEIKRQRKLSMLTQEQLAEKVGVSPTTVHRWEAGRSTPLGVNRARLMETLQLDASLFLQRATVGTAIPTSSVSPCAVHIHIHLTVSGQEQPTMVHSHVSQLQLEDELPDVLQWIAQQLNASQHPGPSYS